MDSKTTPPAKRQGRGHDVPGGTAISIVSAIESASTARVLRRLLDGIEKRRRQSVPPEHIVTWTAGVLRNEIATARRAGGRDDS